MGATPQWRQPAAGWRGGTRDRETGTVRWDPADGALSMAFAEADWTRFRSLHLDLSSARRTAERILLEVLDPSGGCLGSTTFCVDWAGDNPMRLWLDNLEPRGPRTRWAAVGGIRLSRRKAGLWPTELMAGDVACSVDAPRWEVNESDTVIELGWHEQGVRPAEWRVVPDSSTVPTGTVFYRAPQPGTDHRPARELPRGRPTELANGGPTPWLGFGFLQGDEPGRLTVERRFDLDVGEYGEIMAKLLWDRDSELEVTAMVDGGRQVTIAGGERGREGFGQWITFGAELAGARILRSVRVTVAESPDRRIEGREIGANLFWILLRRPSALDDMPLRTVTVRLQHTEIWPIDTSATARRDVRAVPFAEPPESTTPIGDPVADGLPFGFFVRREELAALRRRALGPQEPIFREIRAEADRGIATELTDRNYYGTLFGGGIGHPKGLRGAGMRVYAPVVAATHLITGEEQYAVAARRWILRAAHSDDWRAEHGGCLDRPQAGERLPYWDSFIGWHPRGFAGSLNHPFWVADASFGIVVAYDMLYHCFSPDERRTVEDSFARLGTYILADKLREQYSFYIRMNQGVLFALPLLMQTAFLVRRDARYAELYRFALEFVEEFGRTPWNGEGVCGEGPGYGVGTVGLYVEALSVLAACLGKEIEEVVPESFPRVMRYLQHMRSTWDAPGSDGRPHFLGISDGCETEWIGPQVLAFFAGRLRDPVARFFWDERFGADTAPASLPALLYLEAGEPAAPELPPAAVYREQPMAFLRTGWRIGDSLVMLNNIREVTGHGHRDRLSVIFEYDGEQLLLDPGMIGYADPSGALYKGSACHNTITFGGRDQRSGLVAFDTAITDFQTTSGDRCPGDPAGIDWVTADATAVYEGARRVRRHVVFLRPCVVLLLDDVETDRPEEAWLNFTVLGPLRMEGSRAVSETGRNRLVLATVADQAVATETSLWGTHWPTVPSYRLLRRLPAARRAVLLTALAAAPAAGPPPAVETASGPGWIGARVRWVDGEGVHHDELCFRRTTEGADELRHGAFGIVTDAAAAVVRRTADRVCGAMVLGGSHLSVEGRDVPLPDGRPGTALRGVGGGL